MGLAYYYKIIPSSFDLNFFLMQMIHENELFKEKYANILSSLYNEHRSCVIVSAFICTLCFNHFLKLIIKKKKIFFYTKRKRPLRNIRKRETRIMHNLLMRFML